MTEIYVGVDTNILLHFGQVENLKWLALFPDVSVVNILIATTVQKEMDFLKDTAKGYIQKRSKEFQRLLTTAEDNDQYQYRLVRDGFTVVVHFLAPPRPTDLDANQFDLETNDSRIVAEYFYYQTKHNVAVQVLANDARTVREAKMAHMVSIRPKVWDEDRHETETEAEKKLADEVRELKKELGARPKVRLNGLTVLPQNPLVEGITFDWDAYILSLGKALRDVGRPRSEASLIKEFGLDESQAGSQIRFISPFNSELTPDQLDDYAKAVEVFFSGLDISALDLLDRLQRLSRAYLVDIVVENDGNAPDEMVFIELKLDENGVFIDPADLRGSVDWGLSVPEEPRPTGHIEYRRPLFDDSSAEESPWSLVEAQARFRRYRLQSLLHGHEVRFRVYILPTIYPQKVSALVTLRAKHLLAPITRQLPIEHISAAVTDSVIDDFLMQRSVFLPDDQRELLLRVVNRRRQSTEP